MKIATLSATGIEFDNGTVIQDHHDQDCCENVYADWEQLNDTGILNHEFDEIEIEKVEGSGFRLNGYFVPCYNYQNGYYGSSLELQIKEPHGDKRIIDLNTCIEDHID